MDEYRPEVEKVARAIAAGHGSKIVMHRDGQALTLAATKGFGSWGDSSGKYADKHWREYDGAARFAIAMLRPTIVVFPSIKYKGGSEDLYLPIPSASSSKGEA